MLSEITHIKKDKYYDLTYMWNKKKSAHQGHRYREQFGRCQRERELGEGEGYQKMHTSSYKINKSWGCNVQHGNCSY